MRNYKRDKEENAASRITRRQSFFKSRSHADTDKRYRRGCNAGQMQSAFRFAETRPATGTGVFSRLDGTGAMRASDAREILIVQRIVEHVMSMDVIPDHLRGPVGQRID